MRNDNGALTLSATDLANFLGCRHLTALDMAVAMGAREKPHPVNNPFLEVLWQRGLDHERRYVESLHAEGHEIVDMREGTDVVDRRLQTLQAMKDGADVIVQGALSDGPWAGYPDLLHRVELPSAFGAWSYEVADTKLRLETRAGTILQLGLYSEMLAALQHRRPEKFYVVTPDPLAPKQSYRVDDYAAYFRLIQRQMLEAVALDWEQIAADNYPEPVDQCMVCRWAATCNGKRRRDDHLSLVAGITSAQRRELEARDVHTLAALAQLPLPLPFRPKRGSVHSYVRAREQARLQAASRNAPPPPSYEMLDVEPEKGLCRLPEPTQGDLFIDLEGDPFACEGGREYLWGIADVNGTYYSKWAFTAAGERTAFEWAMDVIAECIAKHPTMHVYHYAPYEPAAFKRMIGRHVTREHELDAMLRSGRFVDLYAVVRQGLRAGIERYSIKNLEPLYAFKREVNLADANRSLRAMELGLETNAAHEIAQTVRDVVEGYNRDDCVSTLGLRGWLEHVRTKLVAEGKEVPRRVLGEGAAPEAVDEKAKRVDALRARLIADVPADVSSRTAAQQGRWLLAYMLDYHRREDKSAWWEYFRLIEMPEEELLDEREAIASMEFVERVRMVKKSMVDRYRYPMQEMEIDPGDEVKLQNKKKFGDVAAVDRRLGTIDVLKGPSRADVHPSAMFVHKFVKSTVMEDSLMRIGESVASAGNSHSVARALLEARPPALTGAAFQKHDGEGDVDFAVRAGTMLDASVLAIQGPPGAGKTYCGAKMICDLVRLGKRVGVTGTSHKVIRNLLDAVAERAAEDRRDVRLAHKCDDAVEEGAARRIAFLRSNDEVAGALASSAASVIGGTAWVWADEALASSIDVLFVDEAGQMSLANVLAMSQAATNVVLLGDPQQLEQPRKGTHPDGVGISVLEHVLRGQQTIPPDLGIFLAETWRLAPRICAFTSELFYEGRLASRDGLDAQRIHGVSGLPASGLVFIPVDHDGNRNYSSEEIDVVEGLVRTLTAPGATWTCVKGGTSTQAITPRDILIVAPYNSQITRLAERLEGTGARVGTVDKFQGQEAAIVIYTMATSRPEDAPRGMEFLYSLNRLNVATSRARCLAIVVASPRLFEPECRSPRQMKLANGLCRYKEIAERREGA